MPDLIFGFEYLIFGFERLIRKLGRGGIRYGKVYGL